MTGKSILTCLICFLLGACAFKKDDAKKDASPNVNPDVVETVEKVSFTGELNEKNVSIQFQDAELPGVYQLVVTWPEEVPAMKVSVQNQPYQIIKDKKLITTVEHDSKITIHLVALNKIGGESSAYTADVNSPKDIIFTDEVALSKSAIYSANRIFFAKRGRIITNGFNLELEAKKIAFESEVTENRSRMLTRDAQILTTIPNRTSPGIEFLKGSNIVIRAQKATGHLRVAMVGFNGIDGESGSNGSTGTTGKNGRDGDAKNFAEYCVSDDGRPCKSPTKFECVTNPTNGERGSAGSSGLDGKNGSNGGNSGVLTAIIEDYSQFKLEVAQRRGQGGRGGLGGKGGAGGPGGVAGNNPLNKCAAANNGPQGPQGSDGKPGLDGNPGLLDDVITNISSLSRYEID